MLTEAQRCFLERGRVGHLATVDAASIPQVLPVCFAVQDDMMFITIDRKPKNQSTRKLKRLENIAANPAVAMVVDHYEETWERLAWVMLRGSAEILTAGEVHRRAQSLLKARYPQYRQMAIDDLPVIAIKIAKVRSWGNLTQSDESPAIAREENHT